MEGRTALVTGASRGIGKAAAVDLARRGARVLLVARDAARGAAALEEIRGRVPGADIRLLLADLSARRDVRALAAEIDGSEERLDVLLLNAGVYTRRRRLTDDGLETQLAVNHLAPFLLTLLLRGRLAASAPSRVVVVSSEAHRHGRIDFGDLQGERRYSGLRAYAQSKLANLLFAREAARRFGVDGVTVNAAHPGVVATNLLFSGFAPLRLVAPFLRTPEQGAATPVRLATDPALTDVSGRYFIDGREARPARAALDDDDARRLWEASLVLAGETSQETT
jgi:NAD(P)-dependent dehydrogenase (short-subunit alcohol dehydrogenase family)